MQGGFSYFACCVYVKSHMCTYKAIIAFIFMLILQALPETLKSLMQNPSRL